MDAAMLAEKMLEWRRLKLQFNEIEEQIKAAVLEQGKTVVVGDVRARYSKPRKTYDYEATARANAPDDIIANADVAVKSIGEPSVKIILEG